MASSTAQKAKEAIEIDKQLISEKADAMHSEVQHTAELAGSQVQANAQTMQADLQMLHSGVRKNTAAVGQKVLRNVLTMHELPSDALKGARGLVFLQAAFAAVGVTSFRGEGFVIANHAGVWSAPAFVHIASLGMGVSVGGTLVDTLVIVYRDQDLDKYIAGDFDVQVAQRTATAVAVPHGPGEHDLPPAVFTATSGRLVVDFSINGGRIKHNQAANEEAYGPATTPAAILSGAVQPDPSLTPLYKEINALTLFHASPGKDAK